MFEAVGKDAQRQRLNFGHCLFKRAPIDHDAWKLHYLGQPASVFFLFTMDIELHRLPDQHAAVAKH